MFAGLDKEQQGEKQASLCVAQTAARRSKALPPCLVKRNATGEGPLNTRATENGLMVHEFLEGKTRF